MSACEILQSGIDAIGDRAKERDLPDGERSMVRTIGSFEQLSRVRLTEVQGWLFMASLKMARATAGAHRLDDYVDAAAYIALAGEAAEREQAAPRIERRQLRTVQRPQCEGSISVDDVRAALTEIRIEAAERDE